MPLQAPPSGKAGAQKQGAVSSTISVTRSSTCSFMVTMTMEREGFKSIQDSEAARTVQLKTLRKKESRAAAEVARVRGRVCWNPRRGFEGNCDNMPFTITHAHVHTYSCVIRSSFCVPGCDLPTWVHHKATMAAPRAWLFCLLLLVLGLRTAASRARQHSMEVRGKCPPCPTPPCPAWPGAPARALMPAEGPAGWALPQSDLTPHCPCAPVQPA